MSTTLSPSSPSSLEIYRVQDGLGLYIMPIGRHEVRVTVIGSLTEPTLSITLTHERLMHMILDADVDRPGTGRASTATATGRELTVRKAGPWHRTGDLQLRLTGELGGGRTAELHIEIDADSVLKHLGRG